MHHRTTKLDEACRHFDKCSDTLGQIGELEEFYQSLANNVDDRVLNLTAIDCLPIKSATDHAPCSRDPSHLHGRDNSCIYSVRDEWEWAKSAAKCLGIHLQNAAEYHKFHHEASHYNRGLQTLATRHLQCNVIVGREQEAVQQLVQQIKDVLRQLLEYEARIQNLFERSTEVVPVHLRKIRTQSPLVVISLVDFTRHPSLTLSENETLQLVDNSDSSKWRVKTSLGVEANLPALIFVIPSPDSNAIAHADRLRQQLMSTWQSMLYVIKNEARSLLGRYLDGRDSRDTSCVSISQRDNVVTCLTNMLRILEPDNPSSVASAVSFQKTVGQWREVVQKLPPSVSDRRSLATRLVDEWQTNDRLLRLVEEFEAYIGSYRASLLSNRQTAQRLINGNDPRSLKYVSHAYIERWPNASTDPSISEQKGQIYDHLIISEMGPSQMDRYISRLEGEIEEYMTETVTECTETEGETTTQTIKETQTFVIRGVVDPRTGEEVSIYQAIADRIISHHQGLYRNPTTGESMPILAAMNAGLIAVERTRRTVEMGELIKSGIIRTTTTRESVTYSVLSIRDPTSGDKISVAEALRRGIIDSNAGRYVINQRTHESISIPAAIDRGFLEVDIISKTLRTPPSKKTAAGEDRANSANSSAVSGDLSAGGSDGLEDDEEEDDGGESGLLVTGVVDPATGERLSLQQAVEQGLVDLSSGTFANRLTGESYPLANAVLHGYLSVELAVGVRPENDPNVIGRKIMRLKTSGDGEEPQEPSGTSSSTVSRPPLQVDVNQNVYSRLKDGVDVTRKGIVDPATGRQLTIDEAFLSGVLSGDPFGLRAEDGSVTGLFDAAVAGRIDMKLFKDLLVALEPMSLEHLIDDSRLDIDTGMFRDPKTGREMSLLAAVESGLLDPHRVFYTHADDDGSRNISSLAHSFKTGNWDPATGEIVDSASGRRLTPGDAIAAGLIDPAINVELMADQIGVLRALDRSTLDAKGVVDADGQEMTVEEAIRKGVLDLANGEFVNPDTGERLSVSEAVERNLISSKIAAAIVSTLGRNSLDKSGFDPVSGDFVDPVTGQRMSVQQAIAEGRMNPAGVFLLDPSTSHLTSLAALIRDGTFHPESGTIRDSTSGSQMRLADAIRGGSVVAGFSAENFLPPEKTVVKDLIVNGRRSGGMEPGVEARFVMPDGSTMSAKAAVNAGLLTSDMTVRVDRKTGDILLADGDQEKLVAALVTTKTTQDWLNGVESTLAGRHLEAVDDVELLNREIAAHKALKASVDGRRTSLSEALQESQKVIDGVKQSRDLSAQQLAQKLRCNTSNVRISFDRVDGELTRRLDKLGGVVQDLATFQQSSDTFKRTMEESEREIEEYRKYVATSEDFSAVRNSFQLDLLSALQMANRLTQHFNDEVTLKDSNLQQLKLAGRKLVEDKQSLEKDEASYRAKLQYSTGDTPPSPSSVPASPSATGTVGKLIDAAEDRFRAVTAESSSLLSKLDSVASSAARFDALSAELNRAIPEAEVNLGRVVDKRNGVKETDDDNEAAIQRRLEEVSVVAGRVARLGKTVDELQKTGNNLVQSLGDLGFGQSSKTDEVAAKVESVKSRYGALQAAVADRQHVADVSIARLRDPGHNLDVLLGWVADAEDRVGRWETAISVDHEVLADQVRQHQALSAELENRRPRVRAVAEACRETDEHRSDELLDRFEAVQSRTDTYGQALEGVVTRMTDVQGRVKQMDAWLGATLNSLKHERSTDRDIDSLKSRIEGLYRQKQGREGDMDRLKVLGRELIDDPTTGDKHRLRETLANVQDKWNELTERLVQMISYTALYEIDDLLKYLDRAENDINSADAISADPETLVVQLSQHKTLHDDLAARRQAVGDTIDRCNRLLRETTSDDADDIRCKLATIRDQADSVHRLSTDRLRALEDALPVAQHFVATHSDLRAWLDEIDAEIRSIDIMADGSSEQIRKQVDSAKVTLRIIEDHRPLVDDLVSIGQELTDMCSAEAGQGVREDVDQIADKYNNVKYSIRDKLHQLNGTLRGNAADVSESLDGLIDELSYLRDQTNNSEPITSNPPDIHEQLADAQVLAEDIKRCAVALSKLHEVINQEPSEDPTEHTELLQKLREAEALETSATDAVLDRVSRLEEALFVAESFQQLFVEVLQALHNVQDNLLSQDGPGADPATLQDQLRELQLIKDDLAAVQPAVGECRHLADQMSAVCGVSGGTISIQKRLEDLNAAIEEIEEGVEKRETDLNKALNRAEQCTNCIEGILSWMPRSEERLQKMLPPATEVRSVRIQLEELKVFKIQTHGHCAELQNLNNLANILKNTSPMSAESLIPNVEDINQRWNQLLTGIGDRERLLRSQLLNLGDVEHGVDDVIGFLHQAESDLLDMEDVCCDPNFIDTQLRKVQLIVRDLTNHKPIIEQLNSAVQKLSKGGKDALHAAIAAKLDEMNDCHNIVTVLAHDRTLQFHDRLRQVKEVFCNMDDLIHWMSDYRNYLKSVSPLSALPDVVRQQQAKFMESYRQLEAKEEEVKSVLMAAEDVVAQSSDDNTIDLREKMEQLSREMLVVRLKADREKQKIDEHTANVQDFHAMLLGHGDWLNTAEKQLTSFRYPSKLVVPVTQQISEYKQFRSDTEHHLDAMMKLEKAGTYLRYFGRKQDTVYIRTLLISTKLRWKKLIRHMDERGRLLTQAYREDKRFHDSWKSLCDWLDVSEQRLRRSLATSTRSKQDLEELQHEMTARQGEYSSASRLGRNLKDRCTKTDPEREVLSGMLDQLKNKWNSLRAAALQCQTKLDEALLSSGRFADALQALMEWLVKAESYVTEDQPTLGDLDTVNVLIEQHKSFQQELASRQTLVEAIRNSANREPESSGRIEELNKAWDSVNRLSNIRDSRLQDSLTLAEEFNEAVQVVREWLPHAEAELKFRAISEDEYGILQLIENHEKFQEELRAQQPNVERIGFLSDEILSGCHPNAVRFVRYYITITQTRWHQACLRSEQRAVRLQEALRMARGSAALVEELLTWLMEAHALLTAKEKDAAPDDLTVVETLLREHMEFHEDLTAKNREMEKLIAAPSGAGSRRLNPSDQDAFGARVGMLQNRWRTVWRLSVERKKLLQDTLDHLLELESFKNFDFDEWRQRYINWIREKKFRITDFFRRQDKNGEGTVLRQQFVEGMMTSKFPTTRTELNAVFDIFDKHRSGEINYSEFMEALRPERQHSKRPGGRAATDAELINDEVENQLSQCQCRRQFAGVKYGEGKYKFGEKAKLYLVRFLNSTVMVRVGGGWITLASFLESNDPCRAKGRLNTDLRASLQQPSLQQPHESVRRPSVPGSPDPGVDNSPQPPSALNGRLSGSVSSLSSNGNSSSGKMSSESSGLSSKRNSNLVKSCVNLSSAATTPTRRGGSQPLKPPAASSTPKQPTSSAARRGSARTASASNLTPTPVVTPTAGGSTPRVNGSTGSAAAGASGGATTRSGRPGTTPTSRATNGSRSGSPASKSGSQDPRNRLTSAKQTMNF